MRAWFAHSLEGSPKSTWEPLGDHLGAVSELSGRFADAFGADELGRIAGLLHDFGKLAPEFQARLDGAGVRVDHAAPGAALAFDRYKGPGPLLAAIIAGHHAGLADGIELGDSESTLTTLDRRIDSARDLARELFKRVPEAGFAVPETVSPPAHFRPRAATEAAKAFSFAFLTRMLFSALVDADFLSTEAFYAAAEGRSIERGDSSSLQDLRNPLVEWFRAKESEAAHEHPGAVNETRARILRSVREQADDPTGIFTLTVPTGGGKTLASLAFALDHALTHGLDRVVVVAPFTSIIEQTADVYRRALGPYASSVLEHHSSFDEERIRERQGRDKRALDAENWDARVIVTTAVQFFESLFANRPSRCRKLHRLARSVIILDEVQTLPLHLLEPIVLAIDELARNYSSSIVLSTATQPALTMREGRTGLPFALENVRELAPDPPKLFTILKRVTVEHAGPLEDSTLAERISREDQVLTIVNTRRHARALYDQLKTTSGTRHLSTFMCAAHRSDVIAGIRTDLMSGRPCRLVSTSLIEAGVDIDFPTVFRASAGLEQIAQAAGRGNREGRRPAETSRVVVFDPGEDNVLPALAPQAAAGRTVMRWAAREGFDLLAPEVIEAYFREVYFMRRPAPGAPNPFDERRIVECLATGSRSLLFPFDTVAARFRLIEDTMAPIVVPYDDNARENLRALHYSDHVRGIARRLQRYTVSVPRRLRAELIGRGAARPIQPDRFECQFVELADGSLYRDDVGLDGSDPTFVEASELIA